MKKQKRKCLNFICRLWGAKTYLISGLITILLFLMTLVFGRRAFSAMAQNLSRSDGYLPLLAVLILFILGVLYSLIGLDKFKINRLSDISIKLTLFSLIFTVAVPLILIPANVYLGLKFDIMIFGIALSILILAESLILTFSLVLLLVSIFKTR